MNTETCDRCGTVFGVGADWRCPHERMQGAVRDDSFIGGKTFENLGDTPVTFHSKTDYRRYLQTHGIEECVRHVPVPGSDKSPHTTSWAAVSQETLDGAKAMLERVGTGTDPVRPSYIQSIETYIRDEAGYVTTPIRGVHVD